MTKSDIWMPLFIGDYLADTARLTTEQHGAYLLLMMDYWRNGAPPDEDVVLSSITKMTLKEWKISKKIVMKFFTLIEGFWIQNRIEKEIKNAREKKNKAAEKARMAAGSRWGNHKNEDAPSNASSINKTMLKDMLKECPSPSPIKKENNKKKKASPSNEVNFYEVSEKVVNDYKELRKSKRAVITQTGIDRIKTEAGKAGISLEDALTQCCSQGWAGFKAGWVKNEQPQREEPLYE
jgi:uncharacterized protein YdaU (DUF1376 family)